MTTRYVATTGNDANPGTLASPWRTIQKACNSATTGDTVIISAGTYAPFAATRNLYIEAATGATVIVQPTATYTKNFSTAAGAEYVGRISGWTAGHVKGIQFRNARYQWGAGLYVVNCHGTGTEGSRSITIDSCTFDHNHSMGLYVVDSSGIDILSPLAYHNDTGGQFTRSYDCWVSDPVFHDNDQLVDPGRGGNGIVFYRSHDLHVQGSDVGGYTGALFYNNRCPSTLYDLSEPDQDGYPGRDGGAFEYYESWNIVVNGVRGWANENVLETGQQPISAWVANHAYALNALVVPTSANGHYYKATTAGTSGSSQPTWVTNGTTNSDGSVVWTDQGAIARSDGLQFHHNIFYSSDPGYPAPYWTGTTYGLILRAAQGGLFHHNTYYGLGKDVLLVQTGGSFAGSVVGLAIKDSIGFGGGSGTRIETIAVGASVTADYDLLYNPGGSLGVRTGDETHGILNVDPVFVDRTARNFHLASTSTAIGAASDGSDMGALPAVSPPPPPPPPVDPPPDPGPPPPPVDPPPPSGTYVPGTGHGKKSRRLMLIL